MQVLDDLAVQARGLHQQKMFIQDGLQEISVGILRQEEPTAESGVEQPDGTEAHREMQAQAARLLANLSAHHHPNKAAVLAAGGLEALAAAAAKSCQSLSSLGAAKLLLEAVYGLGNLASSADTRAR